MKRKLSVALVLLLCLFMTSSCIVSADFFIADEDDYYDDYYYDDEYEIYQLYNGVCAVRKEGGYLSALTDIYGDLLVDFEYDYLKILQYGKDVRVDAQLIDDHGVIDENGKEIIPIKYSFINCWDDERIFAIDAKEKKIDIYDFDGKFISSCECDPGDARFIVFPLCEDLYYYSEVPSDEDDYPQYNNNIIDKNGKIVSRAMDIGCSMIMGAASVGYSDYLPWNMTDGKIWFEGIINGDYTLVNLNADGTFSGETINLGELARTEDRGFLGFDDRGNIVIGNAGGTECSCYNPKTLELEDELICYKLNKDHIIIGRDHDGTGEKYYLYDRSGNCICEADGKICMLDNAYALFNGTRNVEIYSMDGRKLNDERYFDVNVDFGFFVCEDAEGDLVVMDDKGNIVEPVYPWEFTYEYSLGLSGCSSNGKYEDQDAYYFLTDYGIAKATKE